MFTHKILRMAGIAEGCDLAKPLCPSCFLWQEGAHRAETERPPTFARADAMVKGEPTSSPHKKTIRSFPKVGFSFSCQG